MQTSRPSTVARWARFHSQIRRQFRRKLRGRAWLPFWLLLPSLIVIGLIQLYPAFYTFVLSTQRTEAGTGRMIFVGMDNFARLLTSTAFIQSLWHTLFFLGGYVLLTMTLALGIALLLRARVRLRPLYITLLFIPWVISDVIAGVVWRLFVVPDYGQFAPFFANPARFGEPNGISILTSPARDQLSLYIPFPPAPALIFLIFAAAWKVLPFITLLMLAALQTVPREVQESAAIDGATGWQALRFITLPLILPMLTVALFNLTLGGINGVGMVLSLTGGGPGNATEVLSYLLYSTGFSMLDFGLAGALSVVLAVINFALILFTLRTARAYEGHI
ncbi:MAG: sugar ABC transporter permease [Litorilinea sp.]